MKGIFIGTISILALVVLIFAGINAFLTTVDVNQYRDQIAAALSQKTGRTVNLSGPITLGASWKGTTLSLLNVSIGNPPWASRPVMANIGRMDCSISFLPLLKHRFVITNLEISNADIMLEAENGGKNNWKFLPAAPIEKAENQSGISVAVEADKLSIIDSEITLYDRDGNARFFRIDNMLVNGGYKASLNLKAEYDGIPLTLNIKTGASDLMPPRGAWPFNADLTYANYKANAEGSVDIDAETAAIPRYAIKTGKSNISGGADVNWQGDRPFLQGTLVADSIAPSDFTITANTQGKADPAPSRPSTHLLSDAPLSLSWLKAFNALFDIKVGSIVLTNGILGQTTGTLGIKDGVLTLLPLKTMLGNAAIEGQLQIGNNGISPSQFGVALSGRHVALDDIFRMITSRALLSGGANFDIKIAGAGNSTREIASNAVGIIDLVAGGGNVVNSSAASLFMDLFVSKGSNTLNCLAARFIVDKGIARDNGILMDTGTTTIAGQGNLNLGRETIDIILRTKTKRVNVGELLPAAYIGGTFLDPRFSVDPSEVMQNVEGVLMDDNTAKNSVPDILAQKGQNACVYTLENPAQQTSTSDDPIPPGFIGKAEDALKNIQGLFKGFMGQ